MMNVQAGRNMTPFVTVLCSGFLMVLAKTSRQDVFNLHDQSMPQQGGNATGLKTPLSRTSTHKLLTGADLAFSTSVQGRGAPRSSRWRRFVYFPTGSTITVSVDFAIPVGTSGATVTVSPSIAFQPTTVAGRYRYHRRISERAGLLNMATDAFSQVGLDGENCVSRMVCEASSAPLHEDGLLGDVINTLLLDDKYDSLENEVDHGSSEWNNYTDSTKWKTLYNMKGLMEARNYGAGNGNCAKKYSQCPVSVFEIV